MTTVQAPFTQEQMQRLQPKLQAFYDALPEGEQGIMQAILNRAAGEAEVRGYGESISVKLFGVRVSPSDGGGGGTDPNHGKDGATIAAQPGGTPSGGTTSVGISIRF